jgi:hypothetical protein
VLVVPDHPRSEAGAEEVASAAVPEVEALGVASAQVLDTRGELRLRRVDDRVPVVRHQAEDDDLPVVAFDRLREVAQERAAVVVVTADLGAVDSACGDVVQRRRRQLGAQHARHVSTVAAKNGRIVRVDESSRFRDVRTCPTEPRPGV